MDIIKRDVVPPLPPGPEVETESVESDASPASAAGARPAADPLKTLELKPRIIEALSTVYDPEIPVNIYDLGLIYDIIIDAAGAVTVKMTLTAPGCPAALSLPGEVESTVRGMPGVTAARVELVWDPPWSKDRMSEAAKLQLGIPW